MRISDWSSDVCSSDLFDPAARLIVTRTCLSRLAGEGDAVREIVAQAELLAAVRRYDFAPDDGPERDFGAFDLRGERILFKIDYYDPALEFGSRSEEHTSELQSLMRISYAVFCLNKITLLLQFIRLDLLKELMIMLPLLIWLTTDI